MKTPLNFKSAPEKVFRRLLIIFLASFIGRSGALAEDTHWETNYEHQKMEEKIRSHATIVYKLSVLGRLQRHRVKWEYWPLDEAIKQVLGEVGESFVRHRKIYLMASKGDLKIVIDPVGHYFRITRGNQFNGKDVFLDRYLHPTRALKDLDADLVASLPFRVEDLTPTTEIPVPSKTHFNYLPPDHGSLLENNQAAIWAEYDHIMINDEWARLRSIVMEAEHNKRNVLFGYLDFNKLTDVEKNFVLNASQELSTSYDVRPFLNMAREGDETLWMDVYRDWFNDWTHAQWHESNFWRIEFQTEIFQRLQKRVEVLNRLGQRIGKDLVYWYDHNYKSFPATLAQRKAFLDFREKPRAQLRLSSLTIESNKKFWEQLLTIPWEALPKITQRRIMEFAPLDLDSESHRAIFQLAKDRHEGDWWKAIHKVILLTPSSELRKTKPHLKVCRHLISHSEGE